jgi:hypothetical protein
VVISRHTAAEVLRRLCSLQHTVHSPLLRPPLDVGAPVFVALQTAIGDAVSRLYADVMIALIRVYPDLDPDGPDHEALRTSSPDCGGVIPSGELDAFVRAVPPVMARALREIEELKALVALKDGMAAADFAAACEPSRLQLEEVINIAQGWCNWQFEPR